MNLSLLPQETDLYQLLKNTCQTNHEIIMRECADGAIVVECWECPFHKVLDNKEEAFVREQG